MTKKKTGIWTLSVLILSVLTYVFAFIAKSGGFGYFASEEKISFASGNTQLYEAARNAEGSLYAPASYILAEGANNPIGEVCETLYSSNIFRGDAAYNTATYDRMVNVVNNGTSVTIGNVTKNFNNWTRYCAFTAKAGESVVTSKMSTGVNNSANRLVFMAPYSGYYEIVPSAVSSDSTASVCLDLGAYIEEFSVHTANFKITNAQTNDNYTDITLYAINENGESNMTGNIIPTDNIYLSAGEKIYITTSTDVDWFDYKHVQTVFVKFNLSVRFKTASPSQKTYTLNFDPVNMLSLANLSGDGMSSTAPLTVQTKNYADSDYLAASTVRQIDENIYVVGNNSSANWDKYSALWVNTETGISSAKLVGVNSGVKLILTSPIDAKYKLDLNTADEPSLELCLGSFADRFKDEDKVTVTIAGDTTHTIELTKAFPTADISSLEFDLSAGDSLTFTVTTTALWFDEPENQTVTVNMNFDMVSIFGEQDINVSTVYDPYQSIIGKISEAANSTGDRYAEERLIDYSGSAFQTINKYYANAAGQYASIEDGKMYTYGKTWADRAFRGSFVFEDGKEYITAIMGMEGEDCIQTLRFTAPEAGCYAIEPKYLGNGESAWLKCSSMNFSKTEVNFKIIKGEKEEIYNSGALKCYDSVVLSEIPVVYLEAGETLDFKFSALSTEWNTNPRISVSFDIAKLGI